MEGATNTMATLLEDLSAVSVSVLSGVGSVVNTIVANPLLLLTTGFLFLGGAIGILGRLLSKS